MRVNSVPNKFEIFQDYYYDVNGEVITYGEALKLFSQMDKETKSEFEQYYKDETGYEIIDPKGYKPSPDLGDVVCTNKKKKVKKKEKQKDGSIKWVEKEQYVYTSTKKTDLNYVKDGDGNIVRDKNDLPIVNENVEDIRYVSQTKLNNIATKYTIEAFAKGNGMIIDPQWAQYSAEEIIQMENEGVDIPQDVIDAAHSIYESTANTSETEEADDTTEKEPFLDLVPKAQKNIKKCNENNEKIDDKISELLPEENKRQKKLKSKMKDQKNSLKEYEEYIREWRRIQNKVNNGEELTDTEAERYAKITGMLNENKSKDNGFEIDKHEIAKSLNELNILAVLGEDLAEETIEIGDTLADYTSKANYKTTRNQASGQIGFFAALIAMAQGKNLAQEANAIGNDTKDYTDETHQSIMDIANIVGIEGSIADLKGDSAENDIQITNESVESEKSGETAPENNEEKVENDVAQKNNDTKEEDFIINDKNVLKLIDEAGITNDELRKQIVFALESIKEAKSDELFAKFASKKIEKLANEFNKQEEVRQEQIQKLEEENENINEEKERAERIPEAVTISETENENDNKTLDSNNKEIENIKAESDKAREDFKVQTTTEKSIINEAIPSEDEAFNSNTEFKNTLIPMFTEQLDFTNASGITLAKIGTYMFEMGLAQMVGFVFSKRAIWLMHEGLKNMTIGAQAQKEATKPYIEVATKATTEAETLTGEALTELTNIDAKIVSVTGDDTAETPASDKQSTEENSENGIVEANTEASVNDIDNTKTTTPQAETQTKTQATTQTASTAKAKAATSKPVKGGALGQMIAASHDEKDRIKEIAKGDGSSVAPSKASTKSQKPEDQDARKAGPVLQKDSDKAGDAVKQAGSIAKDDSKDSEQLEKDTKKDKKTLEKETKQLQKQLKKDEKEVIKMTKESMEAAKKQEEILAEYEALVAENEELMAEDEAKQQAQAAIGAPQQTNNANKQGGLLATNSMTVGAFVSTQSDNTDRLTQNGARIDELGTKFKICGNVINRNQAKITKIQKSTKTKQKKLKKKTKILDKKIKADEKKEQEKQKRLAKQLAIVGIQENVFALVNAVGTIYTLVTAPALLANPFTVPAGAATLAIGQILMAVGTAGTALCGVTKAIINLANGNLTAALIGLGTTAVSVATSLVGGGAATSSVLTAVSTGLSVVSTSAEFVNNVRAVQGKEASGVFSKIATIAGVAGSITNAAGSLKDIGKATDTFGKALTIASVAGTAMSSASQIMSEFGGESKLANILGMVGSGIQMAASVAQIAQKFSGAEAKNEENKQKTERNEQQKPENSDKNPDGTPKTEEQKKAELDEAKKAKNDKKKEAKNVKDKSQKENIEKNGSSKYYSDRTDEQLRTELAQIEANQTLGTTSIGADKIRLELAQRASYRAKMGVLDAHNQARQQNIETGIKIGSSALQLGMQIYASSKSGDQQDDPRRGYAAQWDRDKMKKVNEYKKKRLLRLNAMKNYRKV